jgi:hypothetical protein
MQPFAPDRPPDDPCAVDHGSRRARTAHREPGDDFYCLRYELWYPSIDCAIRTRYRTAPGCANCDQGRFNLRRHAGALARGDRTLARVLGD